MEPRREKARRSGPEDVGLARLCPNVVPGSVVTTNALTPLWKNAKSFAAFERTGDETKLPKTRKSVNNVAKITLSDDVLEKAAPLGSFSVRCSKRSFRKWPPATSPGRAPCCTAP